MKPRARFILISLFFLLPLTAGSQANKYLLSYEYDHSTFTPQGKGFLNKLSFKYKLNKEIAFHTTLQTEERPTDWYNLTTLTGFSYKGFEFDFISSDDNRETTSRGFSVNGELPLVKGLGLLLGFQRRQFRIAEAYNHLEIVSPGLIYYSTEGTVVICRDYNSYDSFNARSHSVWIEIRHSLRPGSMTYLGYSSGKSVDDLDAYIQGRFTYFTSWYLKHKFMINDSFSFILGAKTWELQKFYFRDVITLGGEYKW